jgi:YggT family protein
MRVYDALRVIVFLAGLAAVVVAVGSWAVTSRRIPPFSRLARILRSVSDPVLAPVERWLVTRGRNPQDAPWWLLGLVVIAGIVVLTIGQWLIRTGETMLAASQHDPHGLARLAVYLTGQVVLLALIARVIGSWMGAGRYNRLLRPAYRITDWIVEPLRRFIPPIGIVDITPIVAWFLLQLVLGLVLKLI